MPSTALNSAMQGEFENAALAAIHFAINGLTFGFAELTGTPKAVKKRNFGQTLERVNVPDGHYLMVPLIGPSSSRSLAGRVVDSVVNPLSMLHSGSVGNAVRTAQIPMNAVAFRANNFEPFNDVKYKSLDPYARTRSFYYQRQSGIFNNSGGSSQTSTIADEQFDTFFDEMTE
jgi:phospholipid-binding lipoprotein MlaA